jgi:hypothetical protein
MSNDEVEVAAAAHPSSPRYQATSSSTAAFPDNLCQEVSDAAARLPRFWKTITLSNTLQNCGILLGTIVALSTIYYAVRGYYIAKWTAMKDDYEWCENEVVC